MNTHPKAIGGYFELELPKIESFPYQNAHQYQSGRSAFRALIQARQPKKIWLPSYICDAMIEPILAERVAVEFYPIGLDFMPETHIHLKECDLLVYVNYFGICSNNENALLNHYNPKSIVFDHSQAFFCPPENNLATIFSPRKFFGVPDGGLLITDLNISEPTQRHPSNINSYTHLIQRLANGPEHGYASYLEAEKNLSDSTPKKVSIATQKILEAIDFESVKKKRNTNFKYLHSHLSKSNQIDIAPIINGPLCYPYLAQDQALKEKLTKNRIYTPTYWRDTLKRVTKHSPEANLTKNLIPLPCDQRYTTEDMEIILDIIGK
jgi:hypothetical protein